nr:putative holin-like toxin [uncultured Marvinbryantia sp.]
MNNRNFDFQDLMAFGMFILALLTFIFLNLK